MRLGILVSIVLSWCVVSEQRCVAQDDLPQMVEAALQADQKLLDDLEERSNKGKLKPAETLALFGKPTPTRQQKNQRFEDLKAKLPTGEATIQVLSPSTMRVGDYGHLSPAVAPNDHALKLNQVLVTQVVSKDAFLGLCCVEGPLRVKGGGPSYVRGIIPMLFKGIPGTTKLVDNDVVTISQPLLVTGRHSYNTVAAGVKTTLVLEPLADCIKRTAKAEK